MPRAKTTITIAEHQKIAKNYQEQINTLQGQVAQRDKLIALMQDGNRRNNTVHNELKNRVNALVSFINTFQQNWETLKSVSIHDTDERVEYDVASRRKALEIQIEYNATYPNRTPRGITAGADMPQEVGKRAN